MYSVSPADHRMAEVVVDVHDFHGVQLKTYVFGGPIEASDIKAALKEEDASYVGSLSKKDSNFLYVGRNELVAGSYSFRLQKPLPSRGLSNNHLSTHTDCFCSVALRLQVYFDGSHVFAV